MTGTWRRVGHIERIPGTGALRVVARSFGHEVQGIITSEGVQRLLAPGSPPAEVLGTRGPDGEVTEKIGTVRRSRSGRGIIVGLVGAPEASGSWGALMGLLRGTRERIILSVLEEDEPKGDNAPGGVLDHGRLDLRMGPGGP
jgi:hypothetical protein